MESALETWSSRVRFIYLGPSISCDFDPNTKPSIMWTDKSQALEYIDGQ